MAKVWDVTIGNNFSKSTVIANNYKRAGDKVLKSWKKIRGSIPRQENFVSSVELIRETEE